MLQHTVASSRLLLLLPRRDSNPRPGIYEHPRLGQSPGPDRHFHATFSAAPAEITP